MESGGQHPRSCVKSNRLVVVRGDVSRGQNGLGR